MIADHDPLCVDESGRHLLDDPDALDRFLRVLDDPGSIYDVEGRREIRRRVGAVVLCVLTLGVGALVLHRAARALPIPTPGPPTAPMILGGD